MRKFIITTCLILSGVLILDSFNFVHSLVMFVLVGVIPGTNTAISADQMLVLVAILLGFSKIIFIENILIVNLLLEGD